MKYPHDTFPGGLKLAGHKAISNQQTIQEAPLSKHFVLPLHQHIGEASLPNVEVGDKVLKGQKIASAQDYVSVPLHAPTSGTIIDISEQPIPHPSGLSAPCITLEADGKDEWINLDPVADFTTLSEHEIRQRIRDAGIVGLGGAGFPSFIKLNPHTHHHVETLIINGIECEPYITCDDMLMRERADKIIAGIVIIRRALRVKQCIIAIEDNKPEAATAMQQAIENRSDIGDTDVMVIPTRYPAGSEKQLVQAVTGKTVPSGGLPLDVSIVCHNVGTCYAIAQAIFHGEPLISRIVTVTGEAVDKPRNFETLIGTPINLLLEHCGSKLSEDDHLIMGGPMMGFELLRYDLPVIKTCNCVLTRISSSKPKPQPLPCIRCGDCAVACPVSLLPQQLYWYTRANDLEKARDYNLFDCIECGCCSYVCPSEIPLVQYFRYAKTEAMTIEAEKRKSEHARDRYDTRLARIALEKEEKAERQRQRKAALAASKKAAEAEKQAEQQDTPT